MLYNSLINYYLYHGIVFINFRKLPALPQYRRRYPGGRLTVNSSNQTPTRLSTPQKESRLKQSILSSPFASSLTGAAAFTVTALAAYILASVLGGSMWFGMILGVTVGALSFCAVRVWLNEDDFAGNGTNAYVIMAGVLSFIGIMLAYITMGMFPFGDHTVLIIDMHHQYVAFFSLLRETILGGGDLLYTDSLGLGAGMLPMWAYYVASPFSLITLIFPKEMITEALLLITVLKITCAGVTFAIFTREKFRRNDFSIVIGGVAFSMMSFFIGHSWNLMWLDPIILLPLVALGFERLMKQGRPALYCITLALALATNYYIGYMVCIFMVFYFIAYIISEKNTAVRPALSAKFWGLYRVALLCLGLLCVTALGAYILNEKTGFGPGVIVTASVGAALCCSAAIAYLVYSIKTKDAPDDNMVGGFWKFYRILLMAAVILGAAVVIIAVEMEKYVLVLAAVAVMLIAASYFISLRFWRFCYASLIGGGMSAVVIMPAFISLMSTSGADDSFARDLASNFSFFQLFPRTLFSAAPSMRGDSLPNVYCTVLALVLFVMYLTCGAIPVRKRIAWGGLVGIIGFSMSLNWLNFAWHGFHFPNDLPYRFSFLMSFAMLCVAVQMLDKLHELRVTSVCVSAIIIAALIFIEQQFGSEADFVMIFVSLAAVVIYSVIIGLHSAGVLRQSLCYALLAVLVFSEAAANATVEMVKLDSKEYYTERVNFVDDFEVNRLAFDLIESYKEGSPNQMMYREELLPRKTCNDPSLFQYNGMTVFASSNRRSVTTLMGKLGYAVNGVNSYLYKNFVPVSDSLLGLKYIALGHSIAGHDQLIDAGAVSDSSEVYSRYIYQNTAALSKAFIVGRSIINWNWEDQNPFVVQNSLLNSAVGAPDVYNLIYLNSSGTVYDELTGTYVNADTGTSVSEFNCTADISGTYFTCSRISDALTANFTASQVLPEGGQAYAYIDCRAAETISVAAGSTNVSVSPSEPYIVDLGYLEPGTTVDTTIYTDMSCGGNIFIATLNKEVFNDAISVLQQGNLNVSEYKPHKITGTVTSSVNGMMFTSIPYDGGWKVLVDGEEVDTFALGDGLLCFAVPSGTHTVTMKYFQSGLLPGLIITVLCIAVFLLLVLRKTRKWIADRVPAALFSADGTDHQFPSLPEADSGDFDDGFDDYEGFEQVDISGGYEAQDSAPIYTQPHRRPEPQADSRPVMPRGELPKGFEKFFED